MDPQQQVEFILVLCRRCGYMAQLGDDEIRSFAGIAVAAHLFRRDVRLHALPDVKQPTGEGSGKGKQAEAPSTSKGSWV